MSDEKNINLNLDILLDVPVKVSVELGSCKMLMKDVLKLAPGSIVNLDKPTDSPVELYVNSKYIGRGEIVVVEDKLGIKITELVNKN